LIKYIFNELDIKNISLSNKIKRNETKQNKTKIKWNKNTYSITIYYYLIKNIPHK